MTLLYLTRHARSTWNATGRMQGWADPPLDEIGREQARALAASLQAESLDAVYSSPLLRARETADIIAAPLNIKIRLDDRLKERNIGEWTGLTGDEANERFPERFNGNWRIVGPPGGETQEAIVKRAAAAINDIIAAHPEETIAVVSHGGTLNTYLAHTLGIPLEKPTHFAFPNTGFIRLYVEGKKTYLLGDDRHLSNMSDAA